MPQVTAYLRVSTVDQDLEKNKADILRLANTLELGMAVLPGESLQQVRLEKPQDCRDSEPIFIAGESRSMAQILKDPDALSAYYGLRHGSSFISKSDQDAGLDTLSPRHATKPHGLEDIPSLALW